METKTTRLLVPHIGRFDNTDIVFSYYKIGLNLLTNKITLSGAIHRRHDVTQFEISDPATIRSFLHDINKQQQNQKLSPLGSAYNAGTVIETIFIVTDLRN